MVNKRLIIFGLGVEGYALFYNKTGRVVAFCDNNSSLWGKNVLEIPVISPDRIRETDFDFIVISSSYHYEDIRRQLLSMEIDEEKIVSLYEQEEMAFKIFENSIKLMNSIARFLKPADREQCFDRHYINDYVKSNARFIEGEVLEFAGGRVCYSKKYGNPEKVYWMAGTRHKEVYAEADFYADLDDVETLPNKQFDCIVATQVIMYMKSPKQALLSLRKMLKPKGSLILTVPGPIYHHSPNSHHMFSFTEESLKYLCETTFGNWDNFQYYGSLENAENMLFWTRYNPTVDVDKEKEYLYTMIMGIRVVNNQEERECTK